VTVPGKGGRKRLGRKARRMNLYTTDEEWTRLRRFFEDRGRSMAGEAQAFLFAEAGIVREAAPASPPDPGKE
jgi:hypothetical protein